MIGISFFTNSIKWEPVSFGGWPVTNNWWSGKDNGAGLDFGIFCFVREFADITTSKINKFFSSRSTTKQTSKFWTFISRISDLAEKNRSYWFWTISQPHKWSNLKQLPITKLASEDAMVKLKKKRLPFINFQI